MSLELSDRHCNPTNLSGTQVFKDVISYQLFNTLQWDMIKYEWNMLNLRSQLSEAGCKSGRGREERDRDTERKGREYISNCQETTCYMCLAPLYAPKCTFLLWGCRTFYYWNIIFIIAQSIGKRAHTYKFSGLILIILWRCWITGNYDLSSKFLPSQYHLRPFLLISQKVSGKLAGKVVSCSDKHLREELMRPSFLKLNSPPSTEGEGIQ